MYAMGQVRMAASEFGSGEECLNSKKKKKKIGKAKGEMGGFVMWEKRSKLWGLELVVSGCKISAGSDGKMAWRQTPWHPSHASRGPPRPLRRFLQRRNERRQEAAKMEMRNRTWVDEGLLRKTVVESSVEEETSFC